MIISFAFLLYLVAQINACNQRGFAGGLVCVCTADDCDTIPNIWSITGNDIKVLFTGPANPGITEKESSFGGQPDGSATLITVDASQRFQSVIGVGGEFSDAAGININKLQGTLQEKVLDSYFGNNGIEYSLCRVPFGAHSFSQRFYSMDDQAGDTNLGSFALQDEDKTLKIPHIKRAFQLRENKQLFLFGSSSSAPVWMKNHEVWHGGSVLKPELYSTWANYHIKALDAYKAEGINFWGLSVGNEPMTGWMRWAQVPSMAWTTDGQATYISQHLGPSLKSSAHPDIKIMINDDSMSLLPNLVALLLDDDNALQYIEGTGVHWYNDKSFDKAVREIAFTSKKSTFVIQSEGSHKEMPPSLGNWTRAIDYIDSLITDFQYGYSGWVERNLALNEAGGPTMFNQPADAPIIIADSLQEFYRQPTYYAMGHFSKYIQPGSVRVRADSATGNVRVVAFTRPDNLRVVSVYNGDTWTRSVQIKDGSRYSQKIEVPAQSINTILYTNA